jgi:hypothetical protein
VRDFWALKCVENGLLLGRDNGCERFDGAVDGDGAERRGRSCLMTFRTASPALAWTVLKAASAVKTMVR